MWPCSAKSWRHHELWEDTGGGGGNAEVASQQEHGAARPASCHQRRPIPEGDQPEGTFTQNCRWWWGAALKTTQMDYAYTVSTNFTKHENNYGLFWWAE